MRDGLPLLPVTPALVVIVGVAIALALTLVGVADFVGPATKLRRCEPRSWRGPSPLVFASPVASTAPRWCRGRDAAPSPIFCSINHNGEVVEDASLGPPSHEQLMRCLLESRGEIQSPLLGRTRFAVQPLGPPLEQLSVLAMVPAPLTPSEARGLVKAVAILTALLVGAAGILAYVFAKDVRDDVTFVRHRIAAMAAADADPAGAPIPVRALDQVGVLTAAFNLLVDRFAAAERSYHQDLTFAAVLDGERSAFLAALSHELRTPLNAILGFADVLLSEVDGPLDEATREELGVIRTSASHLRSLIDDILELSALESGGLKLSRESVDVYAIAEEIVREQRPLAAAKHLRLELSGTRHAIANADPRRLRQILGNIVGNAVKFTSRGGVRIVVDDHGGGEVVVHTIDTGPGIAPAERAAIFEEYAQAGDTATKRKGTGLGLAIARRLVRMHAGEIELASAVGQGSRFTFKLRGRQDGLGDPS